MKQEGKIRATDIEGNEGTYHYSYTATSYGNPHRIRVWPTAARAGEYFELSAWDIEAEGVKIDTMVNNRGPELSKKGVPEGAIVELAALLGTFVRSSPQGASTNLSNHRNDNATKVWERLVERGLASFDEGKDHYQHPPAIAANSTPTGETIGEPSDKPIDEVPAENADRDREVTLAQWKARLESGHPIMTIVVDPPMRAAYQSTGHIFVDIPTMQMLGFEEAAVVRLEISPLGIKALKNIIADWEQKRGQLSSEIASRSSQ